MTRQSVGSPVQSGPVPAAALSALTGSPAASPKAKQLDMMPEKMATAMPLRKLNSATAAAFCAGERAASLRAPAMATTMMPSTVTARPSRMIWPDVVPAISVMKLPSTIGGISVPNTVHRPSTTAMPSDRPR